MWMWTGNCECCFSFASCCIVCWHDWAVGVFLSIAPAPTVVQVDLVVVVGDIVAFYCCLCRFCCCYQNSGRREFVKAPPAIDYCWQARVGFVNRKLCERRSSASFVNAASAQNVAPDERVDTNTNTNTNTSTNKFSWRLTAVTIVVVVVVYFWALHRFLISLADAQLLLSCRCLAWASACLD